MGIAILLGSGFIFNKRIGKEANHDKLMIWFAVLVYFAFSIFLNWYLREIYGWRYGVPGSDLQMYFDGAQALKEGSKLSDLVRINSSFEVSFLHLGYLAYILFIAATVMTPVIFTMELSLQILYCVQSLAAISACINIADFFCEGYENKHLRNRVLWMLLLCTSVLQMSALLMRDIWILFFISCLMRECKKEQGSLVMCLIYVLISFVSRYYTLAITLPILLGYRFDKKKAAALSSLIVFGAFFFGQGLINTVARIVGIRWLYKYSFDLYSILSYILFPSPINQAYNVQHMNMSAHAIFGGNTEWIYYLLSCWNVFVFPVSAFGIFRSIKDKEYEDASLWGMIILNMAMLMCLFYHAVSSPRHKLLIVVSLAYFFKKGYERMNSVVKVAYFFVVLLVLITLFAIA